MGTSPLQDRTAQGRICPGVKVNLAVQSRKYPVFVTAKRKCALHGMPFRMEIDRFLSGKCDLHRTLDFICGQRRDMLSGYVFLAAESSAYQLVLYHDLLRIPSEHNGDLVPCIVHSLVRRIYLDPVLIRKCHRTFRLQERMLCKRRPVRLRHHIF